MQYTCLSCSTRFPQSDLLSHYMTEHTPNGKLLQPIFRCQQCGRTFTARHHFRIHLERAHMLRIEDVLAVIGEQEQLGDICEVPQDYYEPPSLHEAYDLPPPPDTVLQKILCPLCGTGFLSPKNLQRHMDSTHPTPSQIMNYTSLDTWCQDCCKNFSSKYNLDRHLELHKGVKYPCAICKKVYTQKYAWSQHMKATHGEMNEEDNVW